MKRVKWLMAAMLAVAVCLMLKQWMGGNDDGSPGLQNPSVSQTEAKGATRPRPPRLHRPQLLDPNVQATQQGVK